MSEHTFSRVLRLDEVGSTNAVVREAAAADPDAWPHLSAVVARHQSAGRGRAGRGWVTPPGAALTASLLLRPRVPVERIGWLTLLAGLAVVRALRSLAPAAAREIGLKWPNDILVPGVGPELPDWGTARKVGGILTELLPTPAPAAVVGIGINLTQADDELPVPSATSLALAGLAAPEPEDLLDAVGRELRGLLDPWESQGGAAGPAGLLDAVSEVCLTLGREVRVDRPGAAPLRGTAVAIDDQGHLVVRDGHGDRHVVVAGDVLHVRAGGPPAAPGAGPGR